MQNAFELQARSTTTIHVNDRYQYSIHHPPPTHHPQSTTPFGPTKAPAIAATTSKAKFGRSEEAPCSHFTLLAPSDCTGKNPGQDFEKFVDWNRI